MDRGRLLSLKRRITSAPAHDLGEVAEELAKLGMGAPQELVIALAERMEQGAYVLIGPVAQIVAATKNRRLYQAARKNLLDHADTLITLLRGDIPDPAIERRLCDLLYAYFPDSQNAWRSAIVRALEQHGSTACLDDLEAIQWDFTPRVQVARTARAADGDDGRLDPSAGPQRLLQVITRSADITFGDKLHVAVEQVRARATPPATAWANPETPDHPFVLAERYIEAAQQHATDGDLGASLNYCRKALEAALKSVIRMRSLPVKADEPVERLELPKLIAVINSGLVLPKDIRMLIDQVQRDSTTGSHDQGVPPEAILTRAIAQAAIDKYRQIVADLAARLNPKGGVERTGSNTAN